MAVATAAAIGGLALSAGSAAMSFMNASEQQSKQAAAEAAAKAAMEEARKRLSINYANQLSINKEPYELEREAALTQGAQAIQAGQESDRGAAATAGRVQMAMNEAQAGIRTAQSKDLFNIKQQQVKEDSRLRDLNTQLDLGQVEGAQLAARNAQEAATAQQAQGYQGVISTAQQGLNMLPLYFNRTKPVTDFSAAGGQVTYSGNTGSQNQSASYGQFQSPISDQFSNYQDKPSPSWNNYPQPGTEYGMFGTSFSGVGY